MSNQSKPTTGAYKGAEIIINPKPATAEWTDEWLWAVMVDKGRTMEKAFALIRDAHNAALATERENTERYRKYAAEAKGDLQVGHEIHNAACNRIIELEQQLAAEREAWQLATEECHRIIHRKNEDIAAERESYTAALELANRKWIDAEKQLARLEGEK